MAKRNKKTKNEELINVLKKFNPDEYVYVRCTFGKKELVERGWGGGTADITDDESGETYSYDYNLEYTTCWRYGILESDCCSFCVSDLINIFSKKELSECTSKDFRSLRLVETQDGNNDYKLKWKGRIKNSHKELLPEPHELFWTMDISDSEYTFNSIETLEMTYKIDNKTTWMYSTKINEE